MNFLLGTPCKILHENGCKIFEKNHNFKTTTLTHLMKLSGKERVRKIESILLHNLMVFNNQIDYILSLDGNLHMFRIGSDIFPCYTVESIYKGVYHDPSIKSVLGEYEKLKNKVKRSNIRFSMHPGQFTMLVSSSETVIKNSIFDLEYHNTFFDLIGIDSDDNRCEINIHVGKKTEDYIEIFQSSFSRLSQNARKRLSIENDEYSYSIYDLIKLYEKTGIKICFDIHHHLVMFGENFNPERELSTLDKIKESWKGVRPEIHVSQTPEELRNSPKKSDLRQHSDYIYCENFVRNLLYYLEDFDLMIEAKKKNLSAIDLLDKIKKNKEC